MPEEDIREDIYAFFNVKRNASNEDITNAYRRLSKIYHPDKHNDPDLKKHAEELFNKTRKFYDVLIDPQKRAIYDTLGENVLSSEGTGWEVVERHMSPTEIREEYERLQKMKEEQLLQQRTNPSGSVNITLNACDLFRSYEDLEEDYGIGDVRFPEITKMSISQSVEAPATVNDRFIIGGSLMAENGIGSGGLSLAWRRLLGSQMWAETDFGFGDNLAVSCKLFRTFSSKMYGSAQVLGQVTSEGVNPGIVFGLHRQLDKHWTGSISTKLGLQQSVTTSLIFDDARTKRVALALIIGRPASFVLMSYTKKLSENDARLTSSLRWGTIGIITELGYERRVSKHSTAGCLLRINFPRGLSLRLKWTRASQTYLINVILCDQELVPSAFVYGVAAPILTYNILKWCVKPYLDRKREKENAEKLAKASSGVESMRREAEITVELMRSTAERIKDSEVAQKGLVIVEAWYGRLSYGLGSSTSSAPQSSKVIDVRVPLQAMVKDSKLTLYESPKWNLAGFYDPCYGEEKFLRVVYKSADVTHETTIKDDECLIIPKHSHRTKNEDENLMNVTISED